MIDWLERYDELPRAYGAPLADVELRRHPEDFQVYELPPCEPDGEGEHLWVKVRKVGCNTDWVAQQLARMARVKGSAVSYAGRKDRHAVCEQWFSIHLPGLASPELVPETHEFEILETHRHSRKLKTGALKGNRFVITARPIGEPICPHKLAERLAMVEANGVPNYFGLQRFGKFGSNLRQVERWANGTPLPKNRNQRSMTISAARSWLFNQILAGRLRKDLINTVVLGDYCLNDGRQSGFVVNELSKEIQDQANSGSIHPTCALPGESFSEDDFLPYVDLTTESYIPQWCAALSRAGSSTAYRPCRLKISELKVQSNNDGSATFSFFLPPGAFATVVLRELVNMTDASSVLDT